MSDEMHTVEGDPESIMFTPGNPAPHVGPHRIVYLFEPADMEEGRQRRATIGIVQPVVDGDVVVSILLENHTAAYTLNNNLAAAVDKVKELIRHYGPEEIFIPYHRDIVADHTATNRIVTSALQLLNVNVIVNEYPVWFWNQWPWVSLEASGKNRSTALKSIYRSGSGSIRLLKHFRFSVYV